MRFLTAVFAATVLFFTAGSAQATDFVVPKQEVTVKAGEAGVIVPPGKSIPLGELIELSVPTVKPADVAFLTGISYEWKILEDGKERRFKSSDDKSTVWYAAGIKNKKQQVFCIVTFLYVVREKQEDAKSQVIEIATRTNFLYAELLIGDGGPAPEPNPNPTPGPVIPDGKYKMAKKALDLAVAKVVATDREKGAKALATSFNGMASAIKAGAHKDVKKILLETTASNQRALQGVGVDTKVWDAFFTALQDVIFEMYEKDTITTADDFADVWNEIADGLKLVK